MAPPLDVIYVAAAAHDARLTRICIASIRHFYPDAPVKLLAGGTLEPGLKEEAARFWNVGVADFPKGDWGWGFIKLQPLFGPRGERFMVVDSDTVFAGPVLDHRPGEILDFVVDEEEHSEEDICRLYYDWKKVAAFDPQARPPAFVFNSGQWFGVAGLIERGAFDALVRWSPMPPTLRHPDCFMPGDQGVLNYLLNQKAAIEGLRVLPRKIMHWPGWGMEQFSRHQVQSRNAASVVVHWAGMKKARLGAMAGADLLGYFEAIYYSRLPFGAVLRPARAFRYWLEATARPLKIRFRGRMKQALGLLSRRRPPSSSGRSGGSHP